MARATSIAKTVLRAGRIANPSWGRGIPPTARDSADYLSRSSGCGMGRRVRRGAILLLLSAAISIPLGCSAESGAVTSPWPMYQHDTQHTGESPYAGPSSPGLRWTYRTDGTIRASSPAVAADGTVYIGCEDYALYAVNADGTLKWRYYTEWAVDSSPSIDIDGTIYAVSTDGKLYALNADGTLKWEYGTSGVAAFSSPTIGSDGTIYFGSSDATLHAVNPDGTAKWTYETDSWVSSLSPAIDASGIVYFSSNDNYIYAIRPDGALNWRYYAGGGARPSSSPVIAPDGTIYVGGGGFPQSLLAINRDGTLKWACSTDGYIMGAPALGHDGTIYVTSSDGRLYAVHPDSGLKWTYSTGKFWESSPLIDVSGTVHILTWDGKLQAINADGTLKWVYDIGCDWNRSSLAMDRDGTILVGAADGRLLALGEATPGMTATAAPTRAPAPTPSPSSRPSPTITPTSTPPIWPTPPPDDLSRIPTPAPSTPQCIFYGTVQVDGITVPDGTLVTATLEGRISNIFVTTTPAEAYGPSTYELAIYPRDPEVAEARNVYFMIGSLPAQQTGSWTSDGYAQLNLTASPAPGQ
ncbi:PQQ-binding-like beta-propeller repeat protein [Chloroflexota bacterium]